MSSWIRYLRREWRYPLVDAIVNRVLPRKVAQAVKGSNDTRFYGVGSGDVGKELPWNRSVVCALFVGELAQKHRRKRFQDACSFRGYTLGSTIVVRGVLHIFFVSFSTHKQEHKRQSEVSLHSTAQLVAPL